jgi:hypothetical protein
MNRIQGERPLDCLTQVGNGSLQAIVTQVQAYKRMVRADSLRFCKYLNKKK